MYGSPTELSEHHSNSERTPTNKSLLVVEKPEFI